jgi:glutaredoxin
MRAVIWSKNNCIFCAKAKALLDSKKIYYEERNIDDEFSPWTIEDLLQAVPNARSYPQIFIDFKYIGGYDKMITYIQYND